MRLRKINPFKAGLLICLSLGFVTAITGCTARLMPGSAEPTDNTALTDVVGQAAAQATAIIQQAQATALVLQAQAEANALLAQAGTAVPAEIAPLGTVTPTQASVNYQSEGQPATVLASPDYSTNSTPGVTPQATIGPAVEILRVTYGAEGAYIVIYFTATPEAAQTFWPGVLSVTDEASSVVYNEVPVMPVIGPLIARPREQGQPGYVMLVNAPVPLQPDALVTVILGDYKFEHIQVNK